MNKFVHLCHQTDRLIVENDIIFVTCPLDILYCHGKYSNRFECPYEIVQILCYGEIVIARARNCNVYQFNMATGNEVKYLPIEHSEHLYNADNMIFSIIGDYITKFCDGKEIWQIGLNTRSGINGLVFEDMTIYAKAWGGFIHKIDIMNGHTIGKIEVGNSGHSIYLYNGYIFTIRNTRRQISQWRISGEFVRFYNSVSRPIFENGNMYVHSDRNQIATINIETGQYTSFFKHQKTIREIFRGGVILCDDCVLILTKDLQIYRKYETGWIETLFCCDSRLVLKGTHDIYTIADNRKRIFWTLILAKCGINKDVIKKIIFFAEN